MAKFKVVDQDSFEFDPGIPLDNKDIVDRDGYRDTETTVMEMITAGERLRQFRRGEFDIEDDKEFEKVEEYIDPLRNVNEPTVAQVYIDRLENSKKKRMKADGEIKKVDVKIEEEKKKEIENGSV